MVDAVDPARSGELVAAIYEAALDPSRWPAFLHQASRTLNAGVGMFWLHDFSDSSADFGTQGGNVGAVTGLDDADLARYVDYYVGRNVWLPNARNLPEGGVTVSSRLYPERMLKRTEFYGDWLRGRDLFHGIGSAVVKEEERDVKLSFLRSERAGPYNPAELRLMQQLQPHMRNAVALHRRMFRLQALSDSATAALDLLPLGVVLLGPGGMLMHANRRAHEMAASTRALQFTGSGGVHAAAPAATVQLKRLIDQAVRTAGGKGLGAGGSMRLAGPQGGEMQILVTPLPVASSPFGEAAPAIIFCTDPRARIGSLLPALKATYGMTPAEAALTQALVNGRSLKEYALERGVTLNTARTQLKFAVARTGARRQSDLLRIVLTGPAVLGADSAD